MHIVSTKIYTNIHFSISLYLPQLSTVCAHIVSVSNRTQRKKEKICKGLCGRIYKVIQADLWYGNPSVWLVAGLKRVIFTLLVHLTTAWKIYWYDLVPLHWSLLRNILSITSPHHSMQRSKYANTEKKLSTKWKTKTNNFWNAQGSQKRFSSFCITTTNRLE